jgi:hypothetical protein
MPKISKVTVELRAHRKLMLASGGTQSGYWDRYGKVKGQERYTDDLQELMRLKAQAGEQTTVVRY